MESAIYSIYPLSIIFGELEPVLETEHFYLIGVNSIRRRYHTKGHLSLEQIQRIDLKLQQAPASKIKIIVSHQPFMCHFRIGEVLRIFP